MMEISRTSSNSNIYMRYIDHPKSYYKEETIMCTRLESRALFEQVIKRYKWLCFMVNKFVIIKKKLSYEISMIA